ncbi:glycosyltransferase family 2 protein [Candidatus Saccharibacteria bacterium]|nr:glycosyltransferase family 2 protein [Candidatus Saccharibacteria bacterium]
MIRKVKNFSITLYRGTKSLWRKYHFLVPPKLWGKYLRTLFGVVRETVGKGLFLDPFKIAEYNLWIKQTEKIDDKCEDFKYKPLISVLMPVYNVRGDYLKLCIESILGQTYSNFEICIVDDASTKRSTKKILKEYEKNKKIKIKYRTKNGHISTATNDALDMAKGEFIALVDNDDIVEKNAFCEVVKALNNDKKLDLIYSDEDKISLDGRRCDPHFKPDFSPDTLLSMNYICHLSVIRTSLVKKIGGFTVGLEGAQDYDLFLRVTEQIDREKIYHIPKILYHWRMSKKSTALDIDNKEYANDVGKKAIEAALKRRGLKGEVKKDTKSTAYKVIYQLDKEPKVSILIPTKDLADTTRVCLESIYKKTKYKNFEILLINNNSEEEETFKLFDEYKKKYKNFKVVDAKMEFNYSKINNLAAKKADGDILVLLNNDTEIITPRWLTMMVGYAVQPHIGAVGAKLLYPDETVQHAGVIMGLGGVASHAYLGEERDFPGMYGRLRVPYDYAGVTGACLAVEKKKFEEVGGLEEDLKVAYNDVDLDLKLLKAGYFNIVLPMVELYHFESKSRGSDRDPDKIDRFNWEQEYMWNKWGDRLNHDEFYNPNFTNKMWFLLPRK